MLHLYLGVERPLTTLLAAFSYWFISFIRIIQINIDSHVINLLRRKLQKCTFPYRESNPGRLGENQES